MMAESPARGFPGTTQGAGGGVPALSVRRLRVRYGDLEAVHGVDLDVGAGQLVALLGPNGAGKTSTLLAIVGLQEAEGEVRLKGEDISALESWERSARGLGWVPEGRRLLASMTVEENLRVGAYRELDRWGRLSARASQRLQWVFEMFPVLAERRRQLAGTLSGGEQQMVALGRALMSDPGVLLVDEATTGLMPRAAEKVLESLERLKGSGVAILLVEQNVDRALEIADHACVMESGQVVLAGPARQLAGDHRVASAYFGRLGRE